MGGYLDKGAIIHPRKKLFKHNYVEFDFSIGHALALFPFFLIINKKCTVEKVRPPHLLLSDVIPFTNTLSYHYVDDA